MVVGDGIQTDAIHFLHGDVAFLGHLHDLPGGTAQLATGHQQLLDIAAALEGLADGIAAGEQILVGHDIAFLASSGIAVGYRGIVAIAVVTGFLMGTGGTAIVLEAAVAVKLAAFAEAALAIVAKAAALATETALALRLAVSKATVVTVAEAALAAFAKAATLAMEATLALRLAVTEATVVTVTKAALALRLAVAPGALAAITAAFVIKTAAHHGALYLFLAGYLLVLIVKCHVCFSCLSSGGGLLLPRLYGLVCVLRIGGYRFRR